MIKWPDGKSYEGNWINGKIEGYGEMYFPEGKTYKGPFKDGQPHGKGKMFWKDGRVWEGEWDQGRDPPPEAVKISYVKDSN